MSFEGFVDKEVVKMEVVIEVSNKFMVDFYKVFKND